MIRTAAVPRSVRAGAAAVGVVGIIALAGCSAADSGSDTTSDAGSTTDTGSTTDSGSGSGSGGDASYADGTYTAEGSYVTPEAVETITVTVTLEDDVITSVDVSGDPQARESEQYQGQFIGGIADVVVGQDIDEISVSRVAGSSLTSGGFNQAIEQIKSEAAA
ncbi:FMN-binding protein [Microbacterium sp. NPDC019599]|uniref:FMN-binding protein n=1 Tax=Microbacterium sp. NPDC019599 TaxID=3154690 RepID=UPI0033C46DAF